MSTHDDTHNDAYDLGDWVRDHEDQVRGWRAVAGPGFRPCLVDACDRASVTVGLCPSHRLQARRRWLAEQRQQD